MTRYLTMPIVAILAATWIGGLWILAPSDTASAHQQERFQPWAPPSQDGGWRLVASRTTSNAWLYSARTGKVYRVLAKCPQGTLAGCLMPLPVVYGPHHSDDLPSAGDED